MSYLEDVRARTILRMQNAPARRGVNPRSPENENKTLGRCRRCDVVWLFRGRLRVKREGEKLYWTALDKTAFNKSNLISPLDIDEDFRTLIKRNPKGLYCGLYLTVEEARILKNKREALK